MESGRRGGKAICLGTRPLGGSTEEEGVITGLRSCLGSKEFKQRIQHIIPEIQTT